MDMIEYTIRCLGFQARGIAEVVPNPQATKDLLNQAADLLDRAAGKRHDQRGGGEVPEVDRYLAELPFDDTPEAQSSQIAEVERHLADAGIGVAINSRPLSTKEGQPGHPLPASLEDQELFRRLVEIMGELRDRGMIRSVNRPLAGDYAEALVAKALGASRPAGTDRGVDLETGDGLQTERIQVKARRDPERGAASHFDIANLDDRRFDVIVGVVFDQDFTVRKAWRLSWDLVKDLVVPNGAKHRLTFSAIEQALAEGKAVQELELQESRHRQSGPR